jgi:hypothetical protein
VGVLRLEFLSIQSANTLTSIKGIDHFPDNVEQKLLESDY